MSVSLVTVLATVWSVVSLRHSVINKQVRNGEYLSALETMTANFLAGWMNTHIQADNCCWWERLANEWQRSVLTGEPLGCSIQWGLTRGCNKPAVIGAHSATDKRVLISHASVYELHVKCVRLCVIKCEAPSLQCNLLEKRFFSASLYIFNFKYDSHLLKKQIIIMDWIYVVLYFPFRNSKCFRLD